MVWVILAQALWFLIPAYVANPAAVLFGGGTPVDFGRTTKSGTRFLGDGKTWKGLAGGVGTGVLIGLLQQTAATLTGEEALSFGALPSAAAVIIALATGSMLGDLLGSYLKRRMGIERGARALGLDQYDFLLGTFLLLAVFQTGWLLDHYIRGEAALGLLLVILISPALHRGVNVIGYKLGKKDVPW
jgi:CDP-2,3-bis-(O-geranylgeranyl)-sn-glycerol synthase